MRARIHNMSARVQPVYIIRNITNRVYDPQTGNLVRTNTTVKEYNSGILNTISNKDSNPSDNLLFGYVARAKVKRNRKAHQL